MTSLKEMVVGILSNMNKDDIVNKLKSAGIDQNNIEMILKMISIIIMVIKWLKHMSNLVIAFITLYDYKSKQEKVKDFSC